MLWGLGSNSSIGPNFFQRKLLYTSLCMRVPPARARHDAIKVVGGEFPVCYKSCDSDFARHVGMVAAVFVLLGLLSFAGAVVPPC